MFKIAIVEDNQTAMAKLQGYLERYAQENNENFDIAAFGDALAFLDSYRRIYDMVLFGKLNDAFSVTLNVAILC